MPSNSYKYLISAVFTVLHSVAFAKGGIGDIFAGLIAKGLANTVGTSLADPKTVEGALRKMAEEVNATTPTRVDANTRLDNITAGPGARFTYNYTLISNASTEIDRTALMSHLTTKVKPGVCTSSDLKIFLDNKVTIGYSYRGRDGLFVGKLDIKPGDCSLNPSAAQTSTAREHAASVTNSEGVNSATRAIVGTWKCPRTISTYFPDGTVEESFMGNPKTIRRWQVLAGAPNFRISYSPYHNGPGETLELEIRRQSSKAMALIATTGSLIECQRLRGQ